MHSLNDLIKTILFDFELPFNSFSNYFVVYYSDMNKVKFNQRSLAETLTLLCQFKGAPYIKNGSVVAQSRLAKDAKLSQSVISKLLSGFAASTRPENVDKLAKFFSVTPAQVRGEQPIEGIDEAPEDLTAFVERLSRLTEEQRADVMALCELLESKNEKKNRLTTP